MTGLAFFTEALISACSGLHFLSMFLLPSDSGIFSDSTNASDSLKAVPELHSDVQETLEGAKVQAGGLEVPPRDAGSYLGDLTQVHDSSAQVR